MGGVRGPQLFLSKRKGGLIADREPNVPCVRTPFPVGESPFARGPNSAGVMVGKKEATLRPAFAVIRVI